MFSSLDINPYSLVSPCAYDTAWLAMIPHPNQPSKPMFEGCLSWVLNNQTEHGFWGNCDDQSGMPTLECLTATLACVVALRKWNVGSSMISKGLEFIHSSNAKRLLKEMKKEGFIPQWFAIVFPGMVELAEEGSLFQSPSATAQAFMATENSKCLHYLQTLVHKFSNNNNNNIIGVPTTYPMDKDLIKLCIINYVERLGLAEHFAIEIEQLLQQVYKATDLAFHGEFELDELRIFSRKLLQKSILVGAPHTNPFNKLIENELSLPWMARLDHLEHRLFIEQTNEAQSSLWMGKTSFQRWDGKELSGVSKKIFDALDNLVSEMATMYLEQQENSNHDITNWLRKIWYETICSWLTESEWSKNGIVPTMDEYLKVGMTSIATHTLLLPASCFVINPTLPVYSQLRPIQCESVTKLVMTICRLLNDLQSYEKEKEEGKPNSITVYMKNNSEVEMEEAVKYVKEILNKKKKELLEHVMIDGFTNLSKECRLLHLSCLKVFQMFFNSSNRYDSDTEMLDDISKAIYVPLKSIDHEGLEKNLLRPPKSPMIDLTRVKSTTMKCSMNMNKFSQPSKCFVIMNELSLRKHKKVGNWKIATPIRPLQLKLCLI
ncbi:hypothetical protein G4B88_002835 [Cannabis sativa]|uniref:Terpene synthase metal-binding domain-containing protein n=1 Tax=Cannabis sativa TaxID=3483 RepID=A0A7J6ECQ9_CANSA|nr:hypothetical protein G4B88_002835 [Cannabis sativa]